MTQFRSISTQDPLAKLEKTVLDTWQKDNVFQKSVDQRPAEKQYIFYDGPPFATGLPHYGHLVASTIKDIVPRYWTMRGYRVERRFGWDTHGLPIEMEMEKKLNLSGPTSIKEFGVANFNEACRENVLRYTKEWEEVIGRLGRWVDFKNDYKTMDLSFMESVWWVFKALWEKGLVYQDFRVMPFSWRLSTSLSNFEANLDYREVQDPAVTVAMPLIDDDAHLLIWTTTPWTLPSNLAIAVGPEIDYVRARKVNDLQEYIVAQARVQAILGKDAEVLEIFKGSHLIGKRYLPLFDHFADRAIAELGQGGAFRVIGAGHVTTQDGTGLVHMAPDFGEEDFKACKQVGIGIVDSVDDEGNFRECITKFAGQNIKAADPAIITMIKDMGRLFKRDTVQHNYPYCWRSGTPLIYRAVPARFIKVEAIRERMTQLNEQIHWVPEAVGSKRFGNWLGEARDWNVSRNRFWGTPIPIWQCDKCGHEICIGAVSELEQYTNQKVTDIHPHKIDHLQFACQAQSSGCSGQMKRILDVFDCWFESGAMPYAQSHYPFENKSEFEAKFPAQFIAEGLDQTRGWFYTLLVLSTALFDSPPFKNVIVNGLVLAEDGSKMSKSKQNYPPPQRILEEYGADALRAYLINSPIVRAEPLKFSEEGVKEIVRSVLIPLRNAWSFFTQYAQLDQWHPTFGLKSENGDVYQAQEIAQRPELDRWILSVQQSLIAEVNQQMEGYYLYKVVPPMIGFIDDLTNWYIRRSRRRFWRSAQDVAGLQDKANAYATLYDVLVTFAKIMAPVLPFITESMYQHLVVEIGVAQADQNSIHLCDYPQVVVQRIDRALEEQVAIVRQVVSMARALRMKHNLKIRQPLKAINVVHPSQSVLDALKQQEALILEELNLKTLITATDDHELSTLTFKANFKTLGARVGKKMKGIASAIESFSRTQWDILKNGGSIVIDEEAITALDVLVTHHPTEGVVLEVQNALTVALDTAVDLELEKEGLAREVVSRIQKLRKNNQFEINDRINVQLEVNTQTFYEALVEQKQNIAQEVQADDLQITLAEKVQGAEVWDLDELCCGMTIERKLKI
jgi:isoleucyl-tRNA synthetase